MAAHVTLATFTPLWAARKLATHLLRPWERPKKLSNELREVAQFNQQITNSPIKKALAFMQEPLNYLIVSDSDKPYNLVEVVHEHHWLSITVNSFLKTTSSSPCATSVPQVTN